MDTSRSIELGYGTTVVAHGSLDGPHDEQAADQLDGFMDALERLVRSRQAFLEAVVYDAEQSRTQVIAGADQDAFANPGMFRFHFEAVCTRQADMRRLKRMLDNMAADAVPYIERLIDESRVVDASQLYLDGTEQLVLES